MDIILATNIFYKKHDKAITQVQFTTSPNPSIKGRSTNKLNVDSEAFTAIRFKLTSVPLQNTADTEPAVEH